MMNPPWPLQCFTVLSAGRTSLMNFYCQYLISVVVVPSTMNTKNPLLLSIAVVDEVFEDLLSALDWALFPCRPYTPATSIFSSWFSGSPNCSSSAIAHYSKWGLTNDQQIILLCFITYITEGFYSPKSLTRVQLLIHPSSHMFLKELGWQPQLAVSTLGYACPKVKLCNFLLLNCNYHSILHHVPPHLMLSLSLINRASTHKPSHHLQYYENTKLSKNQHRVHQNSSLQFWQNSFLPVLSLSETSFVQIIFLPAGL